MNILVETVHARSIGPIMGYFNDLQNAGALKHRLPEFPDTNVDHALAMVNTPGNLCYFAIDADEKRICGEVTLNGFQGKACQVHFSIHPDYFGNSKAICISTIPHLASLKSPDGSQYVRTLIGPIAKSNRLALRLVKQVGYKHLCEIPDAAYIARENRYEPMVLSSYDLTQHKV